MAILGIGVEVVEEVYSIPRREVKVEGVNGKTEILERYPPLLNTTIIIIIFIPYLFKIEYLQHCSPVPLPIIRKKSLLDYLLFEYLHPLFVLLLLASVFALTIF